MAGKKAVRRFDPAAGPFSRRCIPWSEERAIRFLERLAASETIGDAAVATNINISTLYYWRKEVDGFKEAWDEAYRLGTDRLEGVAKRRGDIGTFKGVWHKGVRVGEEVENHDSLMMFIMKARDRARFADSQPAAPEGGEPQGGAVTVTGGLPDEPGT